MDLNIKDYIYDKLLPKVEKPGRYIGTEWNSVHKALKGIDIRFAFCFPDSYEVGMSHLGMKILYHLLNDQKDIYCERVFAPWPDMESLMRKEDIKLFALESRDYIQDFDFVGFTLQYEMSYTNIINMLDLAGIPKLASQRREGDPFVVAGGPCAYNPEPLSDFIDFFMLGEGEEQMLEVMEAYRQWKAKGMKREEFLELVSKVRGVYVPSFYDVSYNEDNTIKSIMPNKEGVPERVKKRVIKDLNKAYFPDKIIVPFIDIVHDRIMLEIFRGCTRGCRFCQAGMVYRPVRERTVEELLSIAERLVESSGYEEISLSSLSTGDYSKLSELAEKLLSRYEKDRIGLSLPSLRIDSISLKLLQEVQKVRKTGLTFAPEAGSQRLRDVINKNVTEEDLINSVGAAFDLGYSNVKLYFMIGLPTETMEDVEGIAELGYKVMERYYQVPKDQRGRGINVTISTSCFVPKPFTPFQWEPQDTIEAMREKQKHLQKMLRKKGFTYNWHDPNLSLLEAVFARGDRRLSKVLIRAWELGCKFDGWDEYFKYEAWLQAFKDCGIEPEFYALRKRELEEVLPWSHMDVGVTKKYLKSEYKKALKGETTRDCRTVCTGCGINLLEEGGVCK
ncbi:TIGR03960 family B12-binding radical SAM protein [Lutispora saccharofermentans]|uniref:TIGR03960 family B12-binding radical SAM protein n=1 Tax=Lutispora saccharofermentans TaxID=3024236 RepID=A0ABT1NB11_9FIRM|nr:TIGR03960 family B12-binding radical SAM protein [Lutispora saccharofermentans]MCQ1528462.1 TIGR03960 family B12-binding radical SAM protein [Lutispora saccharofermentans]